MRKRVKMCALFLIVATMSVAPAVAEETANCVTQIVPVYLCDPNNCIQIGWTFETRCSSSSGRGSGGSW
jgi:hypothetical protein